MAKYTKTIRMADSLDEFTPAELADILKHGEIISGYVGTVKAFIHALLSSGTPVPGYALVAGNRSRVWKSEAAAKEAMGAAGINDPYSRELLSVAVAEKKATDATKLASAWEYKPGNPALAATTAAPEPEPDPEPQPGQPKSTYGF